MRMKVRLGSERMAGLEREVESGKEEKKGHKSGERNNGRRKEGEEEEL